MYYLCRANREGLHKLSFEPSEDMLQTLALGGLYLARRGDVSDYKLAGGKVVTLVRYYSPTGYPAGAIAE